MQEVRHVRLCRHLSLIASGPGEDPYNREPLWWSGYSTRGPYYRFLARMNAVRSAAIDVDPAFATTLVSHPHTGYTGELADALSQATPVYASDRDLVLHRGPVIAVFSNRGSSAGDANIAFAAQDVKEGDVLVDVLAEPADYISVGYGGTVRLTIRRGAPKVCDDCRSFRSTTRLILFLRFSFLKSTSKPTRPCWPSL